MSIRYMLKYICKKHSFIKLTRSFFREFQKQIHKTKQQKLNLFKNNAIFTDFVNALLVKLCYLLIFYRNEQILTTYQNFYAIQCNIGLA